MTTHVLIVDDNSFKKHLEFMFVGTGNNHSLAINNGNISPAIHPSTERVQAGMVADCCRMREGDLVIFYLQQSPHHEGTFFGIFKVKAVPDSDVIAFTDSSDDTYPGVEKKLQYRSLIEPFQVYSKGVSEWEALDEIKNITCPSQMLWSLIYRKLKGNRGNTMITLYESERLISLLQTKNQGAALPSQLGGYTYDLSSNSIIATANSRYDVTRCVPIDISNRLRYKYQNNQAHEFHLQAFITKNIGMPACQSLNAALFQKGETINWIGNEVSCGVGMQRMDVVLSTKKASELLENIYVIELKCVPAHDAHIHQMYRYIEWLSQYYVPNRPCVINPILIVRDNNTVAMQSPSFSQATNAFNSNYIGSLNMKPLKVITYRYVNNVITFQ